MTIEEAWEILKNPESKKPSEIGEAIDVLLCQRRKSHKRSGYTWLSEKIGTNRRKINGYRRSFILSEFHNIYRLPRGIRWKIDRREISIAHGLQIARLKSEEDQWLLALAIDYAAGDSDKPSDQLSEKDCKNIVRRVLKKEDSIRNIVGEYGVRFKNLPIPLAFSSPEEWIAVSKEAWNRHMNRPAFCSRLIAQKYSVLSDIEKGVEEISRWMRDFPKSRHEEMESKLQSLAKIIEELRQLAELRQPAAEETVQKTEAEEKGKPNDVGDSGRNPSVSSKEVEEKKEDDVQSGGEPKSPKPSGDGGSDSKAEEKEKPNDVGDSGENPSGSSEKANAEKAINVPSSGDESKSPKPSGDDKTKGKGNRKKKSAKKSGNMKRR